jgi:hypothetical protein
VGSTKFASRTPKETLLEYSQAFIIILTKIYINAIAGKNKKVSAASHQLLLYFYCYFHSSQWAKMAAMKRKKTDFRSLHLDSTIKRASFCFVFFFFGGVGRGWGTDRMAAANFLFY